MGVNSNVKYQFNSTATFKRHGHIQTAVKVEEQIPALVRMLSASDD